MVAGALWAQTATAQSADSVEVAVTAEVPVQCGFAGSETVIGEAADLEQAHKELFRLELRCNAPYAVKARSLNGKLVHLGGAEDGSGYAFEKAYGVRLSLETDQGVVTGARCSSEALREPDGGCELSAPSGLSSGAGVSIGRDAIMTIDWPDQRELERRLAAGAYGDTIILEIGAEA